MPPDIKSDIKAALAIFTVGILSENALKLFEVLGYSGSKSEPHWLIKFAPFLYSINNCLQNEKFEI